MFLIKLSKSNLHGYVWHSYFLNKCKKTITKIYEYIDEH